MSDPQSSPAAVSAAPSPGEIDASCRLPVLVLFSKAAGWLFVAAVLGFIGSLKFHAPGLLADCPWFTYGRVQPAAMNALLYGFAVQAALGIAMWMTARLGRTRVVAATVATGGAIFWNLGVLIGVVSILAGRSTGFEWLEMPREASPVLFCSYACVAVSILLTYARRADRAAYPALWFVVAALFWFPWVYSVGNYLTVFAPVRGILQAVVTWWFQQNLAMLWLGFMGLATIFYFVPKLLGRPLHSRYGALLAFWGLALFGGWGGIPHGAPVPAWMPALSTVFSVFTLVPVAAIAWNLHRTVGGGYGRLLSGKPLAFVAFGALAFLVAAVLWAWQSLPYVSRVTTFTFFTPGRTVLLVYGFAAMTFFGAIYYILPRVSGVEWPASKLVGLHFWFSAVGVLLYGCSMMTGGFAQGRALYDPTVGFLDALSKGILMFRVSTMGDLLLGLGAAALLLNVCGVWWRLCRGCCCLPAWSEAGVLKPTEVRR